MDKIRSYIKLDLEIAKMEIGKQAAYNIAHRKGAPVIRNGKKFLFVRSKLDEWMEGLIG